MLLGAPSAASAAQFFVNRTDDPAPGALATTCNNTSNTDTSTSCSLREAVIKSNANAPASGQSNTITLAAATYTLSHTGPKNADGPSAFDSQANELDIEVSTKVIGQGPGSTTVQAGTNATNGISLIFIINGYSSLPAAKPLDATLQGLTLQFGRNPYIDSGAAWGFGGAVEYESADGGQLTLTNDVITNNSTTDGDGGGVAVFDDAPTGTITSTRSLTTISSTTISNNTAVETEGGGAGGGVFAGTPEPLVITGSTISGNSATNGSGCNANKQCAAGGGVLEFGPNLTGGTPSSITNSTFSGNSTAFRGGGLWNSRPMTISGSTFTGNTLTNAAPVPSGSPGGGGGVYNVSEPNTTAITNSTFTGNSAGGGNGGAVANDGGTLTLTDSRITGNTAAAGAGLNQGADPTLANKTTATEDWWGCNGGPGAAGCDTAANQNTTAGETFTTSPWVTLRTTASPTTILTAASSALTASFLKDSAGTTLTTAQIPELIGLPVSWSATHGAISNQQTAIQANGTATATLTNDNTCNSTSGQATVDSVQAGDGLATATTTVQCPDLTATKTDNVLGATTVGTPWTWNIHVADGGNAAATFSTGQTILHDDLPAGPVYGTATVSGASGITGTGTLSCSIASGVLACTPSGGTVTLAALSSFNVSFTATSSAGGTFANPTAGGTCTVDPSGLIVESNEANNTCSDTVTVTGPDLTAAKTDNVTGAIILGSSFTWKIHVANGGTRAASFATGVAVLRDNLPAGASYGAVSLSGQSGVAGTGSVSCAIASGTLTCTASGGPVTLAAPGAFDVSFTVTPTVAGSLVNPAAGGSCSVDPTGAIAESNETNNACTDTVVVRAPDLTAVKTDDMGATTLVGNSWTWKIHLANGGDAPASFTSGQTILVDGLPSGPTYGAAAISGATGITGAGMVTCTVSSGALSCLASGGPVSIAAAGAFDVSLSASSAVTGTFMNPPAGATCAADPGNVVTEGNEANNACSDTVTVVLPTPVTPPGSGVGPPSASIAAPANSKTFTRGQVVSTSFSCTEATGGPGILGCADSRGAVGPNGRLDTSRTGSFTYRVTAISKDGETATASIAYKVIAPSNRFTLSHLKVHANGQVEFRVNVPGPGRIDALVTAPGHVVFARGHTSARKAGTVKVKLHPGAAGSRLAARRRSKVRLTLRVVFTPTGGPSRSASFHALLQTK